MEGTDWKGQDESSGADLPHWYERPLQNTSGRTQQRSFACNHSSMRSFAGIPQAYQAVLRTGGIPAGAAHLVVWVQSVLRLLQLLERPHRQPGVGVCQRLPSMALRNSCLCLLAM